MSGVTVKPLPSEVRYVEGLQLRDMQADGRYLEARACQFNVPVDVGPFVETMDPGVFDATLSRHAQNIPLILGHDDTVTPVARSTEWRRSPSDLVGVFKFGTHEEARRVVGLVEERMLTSVSVSFLPGRKPEDSSWSLIGGVPHVRRNHARLVHLGLVTSPADEDAGVLAVRSLGVPEDLILKTPHLDSARQRLESLRNRWQ
jgi:HK97 family phage prohead protease